MAKLLRATALGALAVVLAGCWPAPGAGPDRRSHNPFESTIGPDTVDDLELAWSAPLDASPASAPVVSSAAVHVSDNRAVYGFDGRTGRRLWRTPPDEYTGWYQPVALGDRVLAARGDTAGRVSTEAWLDAATGVQEGEIGGGGHVEGLDTERALLHSVSFGSGTTVASGYGVIDIDPSDGTTPGNGGLLELDGRRLPLTLGRQRVYHAGASVPAPGPTPPDRWYDGVRAFTIAPGRTDCGPDIAPYFACPQWATELDGGAVTSPVLSTDEATVYAGSGSGDLYALNAATGAIRWQTDLGAAPVAAPALANGVLYTPLADNRLVAVSSTGTLLWTAPLAGRALQPAVANGLVLVAASTADAGSLEAFPAAGCGSPACSPVWSHEVADPITGAPAISNGHIYITTSPPDTAPTSPAHLLAFAPAS